MQNRVKQRGLALLVTVGMLAVPIAMPASASPHGPGSHGASIHEHALADRNHDHLSDGLDAKLAHADPTGRIDVVATFADRGAMRGARWQLGRVDTTFSLIPGFVARLTPGQVRSLAHRPGVLRVEENFAIHALDDAANRDFGVTAAQNNLAATGAGTEVCVVDTGVDPNHEQLDSKAPIPWVDYVNHGTTPYDDQGHGTHVASIAVGDGVGPGPIAGRTKGVAPAAALSAAKVLDATGSGDDSLGVLGIQWCAGRPSVDVISLSLGSDVPSDGLDALSQAVDAAVVTKGKIVVAAAGNGGDLPGTITSPGSAVQAITVGATADWSSTVPQYGAQGPFLAWFSSRGPTLDNRVKPDIVAPGVNIGAALAGSTSDYVTESGTSMATPHVSGVAALLRQKQPAWTQTNVRNDLTNTAVDVGPAGKDNEWGAGLLDGYAAVAAAAGGSGSTPFPVYQHFARSVADSGVSNTTFTLTAADLGTPIAVTITLHGAPICTLDLGPLGCLLSEWSPDLDAQLFDPNGFAITESTCAAGSECSVGRQETLHAIPTLAGTYTIRVAPYAGDPNNGAGGSFAIDLFHGPVGTAPPPPPSPTVHVGDLDDTSALLATGWRAQVRILVENQDQAVVAGAIVTGKWPNGTTGTCTTNASGLCKIGRKVAKSKLSIVFTVTKVMSAVGAYKPADNHDPDGDSNGTKITLVKP
jgi:serine protease AprX